MGFELWVAFVLLCIWHLRWAVFKLMEFGSCSHIAPCCPLPKTVLAEQPVNAANQQGNTGVCFHKLKPLEHCQWQDQGMKDVLLVLACPDLACS